MPNLEELEELRINAEIENLQAETKKHTFLARNAELEAKFRERRLAEEESSLADAHVFHFFGPVNASNCALAIEEIGAWSRKDPGCPITIVFNSPGGSVWEGLALYDFIQDLKKRGHDVTTKSIGMAASMGGVLLQAGNKRVMSLHGFILIHEVSSIQAGKSSDLEDSLKLVERLQDKILTILSNKSNMTKAQIKRAWKRKDYWIDAEEALKLGFIDTIED